MHFVDDDVRNLRELNRVEQELNRVEQELNKTRRDEFNCPYGMK